MAQSAIIRQVLQLLLLFAVVLASQGMAFAHEFDHVESGDTSSCLICPVGSNVEAAATDSGYLPAQAMLAAPGPKSANRLGHDAFSAGYSARGPPSFL